MEIILDKDVPKLGYRGDVVNVKPGYFRNFLLPEGLAQLATPALKKLAEKRNEKLVMQKEQLLDNAKEVIKKLKGVKISIKAKASEKGKLYGAITEQEIIQEVEKIAKVKLEKEFIKMDSIKEVGDYKVNISLGEGFDTEIKVKVESE